MVFLFDATTSWLLGGEASRLQLRGSTLSSPLATGILVEFPACKEKRVVVKKKKIASMPASPFRKTMPHGSDLTPFRQPDFAAAVSGSPIPEPVAKSGRLSSVNDMDVTLLRHKLLLLRLLLLQEGQGTT